VKLVKNNYYKNSTYFSLNSSKCSASSSCEFNDEVIPISVNWHLSPRCNYHCKYCFGHFRGIDTYLDINDSKALIEQLANVGTKKITFSGGEPFLNPHLGKIITYAKKLDLTTMIVSNGSLTTKKWLDEHEHSLDWLGLSVDSASELVQKQLGRGTGSHVALTKNLVEMIEKYEIRLKINTVITSYNWKEDLHSLILGLQPERWKVFQFLPILGENNLFINQLRISDIKFESFTKKHEDLLPITEKNSDMYGSYIMIDPIGRLFQNTFGTLRYSDPILKIGILRTLQNLGWDKKTFISRNGLYNW